MEPDIQLWTVQIHLTSQCNFSCPYCGYARRKQFKIDLIPWKVKALLEDLKGMPVKGVVFHGGGEPFIWNGGMVVEYIREVGEWCQVAVYTNGSLIPKDLSWMDHCTYICVSWHYANPLTARNIKRMVTYKSEHSLQCLVNVKVLLDKTNYTRIREIYGEVKTLDPDYILFRPVMDLESVGGIELTDAQMRELTYLIHGSEIKNDERTNWQILTEPTNPVVGGMNPKAVSECWCALRGTTAYVTADGNVYVCPTTIGDQKYRIGNINEQRLPAMWNSDLRVEVVSALTSGICYRPNCKLREYNRVLDKFHLLQQSKEEMNLPIKEEFGERVGGIL